MGSSQHKVCHIQYEVLYKWILIGGINTCTASSQKCVPIFGHYLESKVGRSIYSFSTIRPLVNVKLIIHSCDFLENSSITDGVLREISMTMFLTSGDALK